MVEMENIRVVRIGGSKLILRKVLFSLDSKYLLCISGDLVKVYSTATEECVHILRGHKDLVTGLFLNPRNHLQLYTCSVDGTVKVWDFTDGILLKTFVVGWRLYSLYCCFGTEDKIFSIASEYDLDSPDCFQLISVKLPKSTDQEIEAKQLSLILDDVSQEPKCTAFGREVEYVASAKGLRLSVYFFKKKQLLRFPLSASSKKGANNIFTCVACHPKEDCIATGHKDGRIRLWRNFNSKKEYTYTSLHWHHDAVNDLAFSAEGTQLLSGGIESVLVQWRYGSETKKDFLPRLGAAIEHISVSPDGELYCTSHSDNKIMIIQSSLKVTASIQGLMSGENLWTGLVIDPRTKALVLNGKPGHLQFYSLQNDKHLYNLDIIQQEHIHQSGLNQFDVVKAAFDSHGSWLATVEARQEKESEPELQMKLWVFDEQTQSFLLNTTITRPHEDHITGLCFREVDACETPTLVTSSKDGLFKVWVLSSDSDVDRQQTRCWSCDFVGSYHKRQATNCCFSEDGSILAVSFEEIVTIWDSEAWDLKCTFCQPPGNIRAVCFSRASCSIFRLGSTDPVFMCCPPLLSCLLEWSARLKVDVLQVDTCSENVAAFSHQSGFSNLIVFKPSEPRPLYIKKELCQGRICCAVFVPKDVPEAMASESHQWMNRSRLYFLRETQDLLTFTTQSEEDRLALSSKQLVIEENVPMTPFYLLLGKHRQLQQERLDAETGNVAVQSQLPKGSVAIRELLITPAHVLPSASVLCTMFVNSLLIGKAGKGSEMEATEDVEMESEDDSVDDDSDKEAESPKRQEKESKSACFAEDLLPKLSKYEEKELKRIRKLDFSWVSSC
ncbi:WD repeat-containing protein 75 [Protopterus annectens]|uniref:WD repeat-containing protein 75 n=1 Tax=Protopterus annectens TaxID=7888 RepID=UPI001CFA76F3|nr:WD repeat-containing protein 75 [Protopterus annectens]